MNQNAVNDWDYEYGYDYIAEGKHPVRYRKANKNIAINQQAEQVLLDILPPPPEEIEDTRKMLKREVTKEAVRRAEEAARTQEDFKKVVSLWDNLDRNRERRERYHEILRGPVPIESGVDLYDAMIFPEWRTAPEERQLSNGNFNDWLFDCPYKMHDLTTKNYIRKAVMGMKEEHKELLYFLGIRLLSPQEVAELRGQTDRNIRKVRDTALRKVQKQVYKDLKEMIENGYDATLRERQFIRRYENGMEDSP